MRLADNVLVAALAAQVMLPGCVRLCSRVHLVLSMCARLVPRRPCAMKAQQKLTAVALKHVRKMSAHASGEAVESLDAIGGRCNSHFETNAGDIC